MACNISPSSQAEELSTPFFRPQTFYFEEIQTYEKVKKNSTVNIRPAPSLFFLLDESLESRLQTSWHFIPRYLHIHLRGTKTFSSVITVKRSQQGQLILIQH